MPERPVSVENESGIHPWPERPVSVENESGIHPWPERPVSVANKTRAVGPRHRLRSGRRSHGRRAGRGRLEG